MITGTAQADVAMLVVAATSGEFEAGISSEGQTREHALLAFTLGIKNIIVLINKMDEKTVNFSEERFKNIKEEVSSFLKKTGFDPSRVTFVPISGYNGINIMKKAVEMPWYTGPTLLEILDNLVPPNRPTDKPLRLPVQGAFKIKGVGTVVTGRIETGTLRAGKLVRFSHDGFSGEVRSIERHNEVIQEAIPGDNIGFNISGIASKDVVKGSVVGEEKNVPPRICDSFVAQVVILSHPGEIKNGYSPVINCHAAQVTATFTKIIAKIDRRTGAVLENDPACIKSGDAALVLMTPSKPLCIELFNEFPSLGRFAARDMKKTVAVGIVKEINYKK